MVAQARIVSVIAKPDPLTFDLSRTAVLVIDMQNDFGSRGGMFDRAGINITIIRQTIAPTARVLTAARRCGVPVIYLTMQHRPDLADMGDEIAPHRIKHSILEVGTTIASPDGLQSRILVAGEWGTAIIPELQPESDDLIVAKHRYSGFFETPLDSILRGCNIRHLVVTGCTTSVCVESTIRDAMFRDYQCILLGDCTAEPIGSSNVRGNHEATLLTIELLFGWISSSENFVNAVK